MGRLSELDATERQAVVGPYTQICDICAGPIRPGEAFHNCDGTLTCPSCEADEIEALDVFSKSHPGGSL